MEETPGDQFTDDELRALLRAVLGVIRDGASPSPTVESRIEAAVRARTCVGGSCDSD